MQSQRRAPRAPRQVDGSELATFWSSTLGLNAAGCLLPKASRGRNSLSSTSQSSMAGCTWLTASSSLASWPSGCRTTSPPTAQALSSRSRTPTWRQASRTRMRSSCSSCSSRSSRSSTVDRCRTGCATTRRSASWWPALCKKGRCRGRCSRPSGACEAFSPPPNARAGPARTERPRRGLPPGRRARCAGYAYQLTSQSITSNSGGDPAWRRSRPTT